MRAYRIRRDNKLQLSFYFVYLRKHLIPRISILVIISAGPFSANRASQAFDQSISLYFIHQPLLFHCPGVCERSGKRSEMGRKSSGSERSVDRAWQKMMERERTAEREAVFQPGMFPWAAIS